VIAMECVLVVTTSGRNIARRRALAEGSTRSVWPCGAPFFLSRAHGLARGAQR